MCKVERVYPDVRFWEKLEKQLTMFFVTNVLPEVMSHKLQRSVESDSDSDKECLLFLPERKFWLHDSM